MKPNRSQSPVEFRPSLDASLPETKRGIRLRGPLLTPDGRALHDQPTIDVNELLGKPSAETPQKISIHVADYSLPPLEKVEIPCPPPKVDERFVEDRPIAMKHKPANPGGDASVVSRCDDEHSDVRLSLFQDDAEFHDSLAEITKFPDWKPLRNVDASLPHLAGTPAPFGTLFDNDSKTPEYRAVPEYRLNASKETPTGKLDCLSEEFDSLLETMPDIQPTVDSVAKKSLPLVNPPSPRRRRPAPAFRRPVPVYTKNTKGTPTELVAVPSSAEISAETSAEKISNEKISMTQILPAAVSECSLKVFEGHSPNLLPTPTLGEILLTTEALTKSYYKSKLKIPVLKGVNFSVREGEFVSIVGQSGSGKSTLLHLLGTLDNPESGTIHFDGRRIDNLPIKRRDQLRNRSIGLIFQFYHLLPELTTLENVLSPLMIRESVFGYFLRRREHIAKAEHFLEQVGLSHRLNHKPSELSGGEMQRAAIARALVSEPRILFADEPTGNLDAQSSREIIELLRRLNSEHRLTIVMVTHDAAIAKSADRMVRMIDGRIDEMGTTPLI